MVGGGGGESMNVTLGNPLDIYYYCTKIIQRKYDSIMFKLDMETDRGSTNSATAHRQDSG